MGLGILYNGILSAGAPDHVRLFGVLQRLGLCYLIASLVFLFTGVRTQLVIIAVALLGYWAMMSWIPVSGGLRGDLSEWGNLANYVDRLMLKPSQMYEKYGDPEGLLSTIPAVATALLGVLSGQWLKSARTPERKAVGLALAGIACLALGIAWAPFFPVIKKIWTSSFVLVAGGFSLELLALFYWVIDVKGKWRWSLPLIVVGMNALTIYMLSSIVDFEGIARWFLSGTLRMIPTYKDLGLAIGTLLCEWLLLYFMYRQRIFVRV